MILFRDARKYAAFPSLKVGPGDQLWVTFGWNTTRSHYGKAAGGETGGEALYSPDGGETWHRRGVDEEFKPWPPELGSLRLSDGTLVNVGPRMHEVLPKEKKPELEARGI
ncbi:MAG: sialidase family protein, partial [Armatimonadota bacterium]